MKEGWRYKKLGEVCEILDSKRKPITKEKREAGDIPYYGATGCLDFVKNYIFDEKLVLLGEDGAKWGAGEESAYIIEGKSWVNNHAHTLRPKRSILIDEFMVYYLNYSNLQSYITGVTVPKLNQEKMRSIEIPVPPLSEQHSIVARLDAAFSHIDALKANAEKQLNEARKLFQAELTECMRPKEGWEEKKLGEVCRIERGGSPRPIKAFITDDPNGLNWIKIGDTDPQGKYIYSTKEKIKREGLKKSRWVEEDEFLLSNSMSFGRPYILKTNGCIHDGWLVLRDYQKSLFIDYFYYMLLSSIVQKQFKMKAQGSTVSNLNTDRVSSVKISYPSLSVQHAIVSHLDSLSSTIRKLEELQQKTIAECDALKQAMLREVFE